MNVQVSSLYESATQPFIKSGRYFWHFARNKLRYDPVFFALLRLGVLPKRGVLWDLGCGQGILISLLLAARKQFIAGEWPINWPPPPLELDLHGIELRDDCVRAAKFAFNENVVVERADIQDIAISRCSAVMLLDVLHYLPANAQLQLLERVATALEGGGVLLIRESDAQAGFIFQLTQCAERLAGVTRGLLWHKMCYRGITEWVQLLEDFGFIVTTQPMSKGTPFSNTLLIAKR